VKKGLDAARAAWQVNIPAEAPVIAPFAPLELTPWSLLLHVPTVPLADSRNRTALAHAPAVGRVNILMTAPANAQLVPQALTRKHMLLLAPTVPRVDFQNILEENRKLIVQVAGRASFLRQVKASVRNVPRASIQELTLPSAPNVPKDIFNSTRARHLVLHSLLRQQPLLYQPCNSRCRCQMSTATCS